MQTMLMALRIQIRWIRYIVCNRFRSFSRLIVRWVVNKILKLSKIVIEKFFDWYCKE